MMDRSWIGYEAAARVVPVETGQLKAFAKATAEPNPIYSDEGAARAAGHPTIPAPPTYVFTLAQAAPARDIPWDALGLDMRRVLHAEQTFSHHRPIYSGDEITLSSVISDIWDKKGGALEFIAQETRASNQRGELCATMRVTLVVRHG